jgi:hypothetical protein
MPELEALPWQLSMPLPGFAWPRCMHCDCRCAFNRAPYRHRGFLRARACSITHRDCVQDMIRKGRDLERLVLARAVRWHLDDRILVFNNKTVVFED